MEFSRRKFIQSTAMISTGAALLEPGSLFANLISSIPKTVVPDRSLSQFLFLEDLNRLIQVSDIHPSVRQAVQLHFEFFQLGRSWPITEKQFKTVLGAISNSWSPENEVLKTNSMFAMCAGLVAAKAYDQSAGFAPTTLQHKDLDDQTLYRDTYLIKMIQNADPHRPSINPRASLPQVSAEQVSELFYLLQQRNLIRMHTLRAEWSDIIPWLDQLLSYQHQLDRDNAAYGRVYCEPEITKLEKHVISPLFYKEIDPLVLLARSVQMGQVPGRLDLNLTIGQDHYSQYGQALLLGLKQVSACSSFILKEKSIQELTKVLSALNW